MAKHRFTKNEARRQLVKLYMKTLLKECQDRESGQSLGQITEQSGQDVAGWPEEDKKWAKLMLLPPASKRIQ
jgi:hypothetical protein